MSLRNFLIKTVFENVQIFAKVDMIGKGRRNQKDGEFFSSKFYADPTGKEVQTKHFYVQNGDIPIYHVTINVKIYVSTI